MILDKVNSPEDLKRLSLEELLLLAEEIRSEIIRVTAQNGGHLASSLGAVELVLALHRVFDSPRDRILFDVGHQAYAHKLVTGRRTGSTPCGRKGGSPGSPRSPSPPTTPSPRATPPPPSPTPWGWSSPGTSWGRTTTWWR